MKTFIDGREIEQFKIEKARRALPFTPGFLMA